MRTSLRYLRLTLGRGGLQRSLQPVERSLREDGAIVTKQVVGMNLGTVEHLDARDVAGAKFEVRVLVVAGFDEQSRLLDL